MSDEEDEDIDEDEDSQSEDEEASSSSKANPLSALKSKFTENWQRWLTGATNEDIKIVGSTVASHDQKQPAHTGNTAAMATKPGALSQLQHWWGRVRRRGRGEDTKLLHMATSDNL